MNRGRRAAPRGEHCAATREHHLLQRKLFLSDHVCRYSDAAVVGEREVPFRAGEANGSLSSLLWGHMKIHRRRVLAALGTAVAVAAGMATAPGAAAAEPVTWQATDGKLMFLNGARNVLQTHQLGSGTYTDFLAAGSQPAWSPDGSRVAYVKDGRVETRRYTGSTLVKIRAQDSMSGVSDPTFLYTGNTVVYSGGGRLRYAPSDGSRYAQPLFSTAEDGCDRQPSASVNGLIAFVRTGDTCSPPTASSAVWVYDDTTGGFTELTDNGDDPAISPDGTQVAFVREADGLRRVFVINVDGTGSASSPSPTARRPRHGPPAARASPSTTAPTRTRRPPASWT